MRGELQVCVGVASYAPWLRLARATFEDFAFRCRDLGFTAIEPCDRTIKSTEPGYLKEMKGFFAREGFTVPCLDVRNDFTVKDAGEWEANVRHVLDWLRAAHELAVPTARVWAGVRSQDGGAEGRVRRAFERVVPYAEALGVRLALENHGGVSSNPAFVVGLVKHFNSPYFGTCPDFGHLAPDDRYDGLEELIPHSHHIHAKVHGFREDGEEAEMDYARILEMVGRLTRPVYLSIEFEGQTSHVEDNVQGILQTYRLIKKHWPNGGPAPLDGGPDGLARGEAHAAAQPCYR